MSYVMHFAVVDIGWIAIFSPDSCLIDSSLIVSISQDFTFGKLFMILLTSSSSIGMKQAYFTISYVTHFWILSANVFPIFMKCLLKVSAFLVSFFVQAISSIVYDFLFSVKVFTSYQTPFHICIFWKFVNCLFSLYLWLLPYELSVIDFSVL